MIITFPLLLLLAADAHVIAAAVLSWFGVGDLRLALLGFLAAPYVLWLSLASVAMAFARRLR